MAHLKSAHKDERIDDGSRTLLEMGFSRGVAAASDSTRASAAGPDNFLTAHANGQAIATSDMPATTPAIATHPATVEWGHDLDGQHIDECLGNRWMKLSRRFLQLGSFLWRRPLQRKL